MRERLYEDNDLQFAGDFRISEVVLINYKGDTVDITTNVNDINIYEDLTTNFLTGDITFTDNTGLTTLMPILGQEFLSFKVRTPLEPKAANTGEFDFTDHRMAVYSVAKKVRVSPTVETLTLNFISVEGIRDQNVRVSRAFDGPYDDAVAKIVKKKWGLNSKKKCYIQPTRHNHKFVAPNKRPTDIINMLAGKSIPKTSILPVYLFYENGQGFHYRALDSFYFIIKASGGGNSRIVQHPPMFEYFAASSEARGSNNPQDNPKADLRIVEKYDVIRNADVIKNQRMGTWSSRLLTHDSFNKTITDNSFDYIDSYNQIPHMENDEADRSGMDQTPTYRGLLPKAPYDIDDTYMTEDSGKYKRLSDYKDSRFMVASSTAHIHNTNSDTGDNTKEYIQRRTSGLSLLEMMEMRLDVPGNTHINAGHMIQVHIPRYGPVEDPDMPEADNPLVSGRWVITKIRHNFSVSGKKHKMVLTCSKDTYMDGLETKDSRLQTEFTDKGKAVNIYDDSTY